MAHKSVTYTRSENVFVDGQGTVIRQGRSRRKTITTTSRTAGTVVVSMLPYLLSGIVIVLVFAFIIRQQNNGTLPTFRSLLYVLQNAPDVSMSFKISTLIGELGDWGIFNGLRDVINALLGIFDFIGFLVGSMVQFVSYCVYFISWLFFG